MGFTAIWITPVTEQLPQSTGDGTAFHGYWQQDMYVLQLRCIEIATDIGETVTLSIRTTVQRKT